MLRHNAMSKCHVKCHVNCHVKCHVINGEERHEPKAQEEQRAKSLIKNQSHDALLHGVKNGMSQYPM